MRISKRNLGVSNMATDYNEIPEGEPPAIKAMELLRIMIGGCNLLDPRLWWRYLKMEVN